MPLQRDAFTPEQLVILEKLKADCAATDPKDRLTRTDLKMKATAAVIDLASNSSAFETAKLANVSPYTGLTLTLLILLQRVTHWVQNHCSTGTARSSKLSNPNERASKWTTIWARENADAIKDWMIEHSEGEHIGRWQSAVATLTRELPDDEVARLKQLAFDEKQGRGITKKQQIA